MAEIFDTVNISGKRKTHFDQLYNYIIDNERTGEYYGNKKQYDRRHNELKEWVAHIIKRAGDPNFLIPK